MELTQIQTEAINAASREGPVDPRSFARILSLHRPAAAEAFATLKQVGLMRQEGDGRFSLTEDGEALHRRWETQGSAEVRRRTPTWQPR